MLRLHDSLTKSIEEFRPMKKGVVTVYNCGPTVYDYVHIGNLRYFVFTDLLRRHLERRSFEVKQVMNITDVGHMLADADVGEDKMEVAAAKAGRTPQEVAAFYAEAFFKDIDRLDIRRAMIYPRASEHVPEMIGLIDRLLKNGHAYQVQEKAADGSTGASVYFDVASFPAYGRLSGNVIEGLNPGARIEVREAKKHPADFALWIYNPRHLMQWDAPWSRGYPGWHVECSAMSMKYLGETIDIHTGGEDNKFPHHECEIAQAEGATGQPFVRHWLHVTHLMVDGEKMSKSKGNFYTLDDLVKKGYEPRQVRYLLLSTHYRQTLNFTMQGLESAGGALSRFDAFADAVRQAAPEEAGRPTMQAEKALNDFSESMDEDFNVPEALAAAFEYVRAINEKIAEVTLTMRDREAALQFIEGLGDALGFKFGKGASEDEVPEEVTDLIAKRDEARRQRHFAEADRLRDEIRVKGFVVEDTPAGRRVKRV